MVHSWKLEEQYDRLLAQEEGYTSAYTVIDGEGSSRTEVLVLVPIQIKLISYAYYFWYVCIWGMDYID